MPVTRKQLPNKKVNVVIEVKNSKENNLGMALRRARCGCTNAMKPELAGVHRRRRDRPHAEGRGPSSLHVGDAFDIVAANASGTDFHVDRAGTLLQRALRSRVRNHKTEPVEVLVKETLYRWNNWRSPSRTRSGRSTLQHNSFPWKVDKDGEQVITYTVKYTW